MGDQNLPWPFFGPPEFPVRDDPKEPERPEGEDEEAGEGSPSTPNESPERRWDARGRTPGQSNGLSLGTTFLVRGRVVWFHRRGCSNPRSRRGR
jgi:hypothetical protein